MKFVHLTPQPNIGRIKRNGIHCGGGRRGRGVYAVPLMMMQQVTCTDDDRIIPSDPRSSTTLWQWLSSGQQRHRNLAAVLFKSTQDHWPADLYVDIGPTIGVKWINALQACDIKVGDDEINFVENANLEGYGANLHVSVLHESALGAAIWRIQQAGFTTWASCDDSIEIVFRSPIRASLIDRIVPLYRTNKQFKQDRRRSDSAG